MSSSIEIRPQPTQEKALASAADILIFGGGAGGGKSWSLLIEPLRHVSNPNFGAVIFRRTSPQITNEGGLWDESAKLYPHFRAVPKQNDHSWRFPSKAVVSFGHLQHDKNVHAWQGSQICLLGFDELTHFSQSQFFYMLSRNRSMCGVQPYVRATTNPDSTSWVRRFIDWWIDAETGFPIPERAGVLRYFVRINNELEWADSPKELARRFPALAEKMGDGFAKSVTFIPSTVYDNKHLLDADPSYLANLLALPLVEREQLLGGNWNVKREAGKFFNRAWFDVVSELPATAGQRVIDVRFWDFAATERKIASDDPDFTAGVLIRHYPSLNLFYVLDCIAVQANPAETDRLFFQVASLDAERSKRDKTRLKIRWEIEGGASGKRDSHRLTTQLAGLDAKGIRDTRDKFARARALAVQAEAGNVKVLNREWTEAFLNHLHGQPDLIHDDIMDGASGAFNACLSAISGQNVSY